MQKTNPAVLAAAEQIKKVAKPVTVIGGAGFVGAHLCEYLRSFGISPIVPKKGDESILLKDMGYVFYCAGLTADYASRPFDGVEAHVSLLSRLLQKSEFKRLVYLSSTRLYDFADAAGHESADISLNPANPRHVYDASKLLGEWLCLNASGGRAVVARLASVYSHDWSDRNFLHQMLEKSSINREFDVDSAPDAARDYVYMTDVCDALIAMAVGGQHKIYNVASGENIRNDRLFAMIESCTGARIQATRPPSGMVAPVIDISALKTDFGLHPASLGDMMRGITQRNGIERHGTC